MKRWFYIKENLKHLSFTNSAIAGISKVVFVKHDGKEVSTS